jgi:AcrR family transcriptional regulator
MRMRQNPARRAALLDAALEVLAREGARGLTFRAVDTEAQVPVGTASNYFSSRDELLTQVGHRYYERLEPDAAVLDAALAGPRDRDRVTELMHDIVERVTIPQRAGDRRFASVVELLEADGGERVVRFAYSTDGVARRGPVTLRLRDIGRLRAALAEHPALAQALGLPP